jgi:hypothetical protein
MAKKKTTSPTWNTIHIFGYGETQVISGTLNKKVASSDLTSLQAVVDDVYSHKPADSTAGTSYHAINIFKDLFADYIPSGKDEKSFRVPYSDLNSALLEALVIEVDAIPVPEPTPLP